MSDTASRDGNRIPTLLGVSSANFSDPTTVAVNPSTHALLIEGSISATNPSIGPNGDPVPDESTQIGFEDGSGNLTNISSSNPLPVTGGGGGTQYDVGDAAGATDTGTLALVVRDDALSTLGDADGDYVQLRTTSVGRLWASAVIDTALPAGTNNIGSIDDITGTISLPTGASTLAEQQTQTTALGTLLTSANFAAAFGTAGTPDTQVLSIQGITSMTPILVDGSGSTQPISGTVTANAGTNLNTSALALESGGNLADIAASAAILDDWDESDRAKVNPIVGVSGVEGGAGGVTVATQRVALANDVGLPLGGSTVQARDTSFYGDDLTTGILAVGLRLYNAGGSPGYDRAPGTATDGLLVNLGSNNDVAAVGTVADDATTPGNPVMVGGFAKSPDGTDPSSVAEDDVARAITDLNRRVYVNTHHPRSVYKHLNGSTAYTDESLFADPGDGFQTVITSIIVATGAATAMNFFLEEGSTTIFGPIYLEAVAGRGFVSGPIFLPITASTAVTITTSASIAQSIHADAYIQAV